MFPDLTGKIDKYVSDSYLSTNVKRQSIVLCHIFAL